MIAAKKLSGDQLNTARHFLLSCRLVRHPSSERFPTSGNDITAKFNAVNILQRYFFPGPQARRKIMGLETLNFFNRKKTK